LIKNFVKGWFLKIYDIWIVKSYHNQENQHFINVQISEIKLIKHFIEIDDLLNAYLKYRKSIGDALSKPTRTTGLTGSEVCTILVAYQYSGYKCFEYFHRQVVPDVYADCFPKAPTYKRFLALTPRAAELTYLWLLYCVGCA
jgi:hypothetical protein